MLKRFVRRLHLAETYLHRFDVIYIDREIFDTPSCAFELQFKKRSPCLVLDVDDAVFLRYPEKFDKLVAMSDLLVAGNSMLRERFQNVHPHILIMPTCIDLDEYRVSDQKPINSPPIVGWMGTTTNLSYLKIVATALRKLATLCDFELRLVAGEDHPLKEIDLSGVKIRFIPWNPRTEVAEMAKFDVGIMPLRDDEWSKYKCGLKLLQYMSLGIPGVASPVGVNAEIIDTGVNGFLSSDDETWVAALHTLVTDAALRRSMGQAARKTVEERYSLDVNVPRLELALQETQKRKSHHPHT